MKVIAYDPYVPAARAAQMGVRSVSLDELLRESDVISVHLLGPRRRSASSASRRWRRSSRRSGSSTRLGAASSTSTPLHWPSRRDGWPGPESTFASEPCTDSPLFHSTSTASSSHPTWVRPRRGPGEGRRRGGAIGPAGAGRRAGPDAVNVKGGAIAEDVRPGIPLAEKLADLHRAGRWRRGAARRRGTRRDRPARREDPGACCTQGRLRRRRRGPGHLRQRPRDRGRPRGEVVRLVTDEESPDHRNLVTVRGTWPTAGRSRCPAR